MKKLIIAFYITLSLFITGAIAEDKIINEKIKIKEDSTTKAQYFEGKNGTKYDMQEVVLSADYTLKKPVIDETKTLNAEEKDLVEKTLKQNGRGLIHIALKPAKNDYQDDKHRGTVDYTPACHNYSFHKVIIPDGTIIKETNFTQREMDTDAIQGENLTFIDCNMVNVRIKASWHLESCNTTTVDFPKREAEEAARLEAMKAEVVK